jgi:Putative beta-barrel porin-2, OmpL-like. bbp2
VAERVQLQHAARRRIRLDYVASPQLTLSYDNFFGDVAADRTPTKYRLYHDVIAQLTPSSRWQLAATFSLGTQSRSAPDGTTATWYGFSTFAKYQVSPQVSLVARVERYSDPDQVIVITGLPDAFRANGASLGVDVKLLSRLLWRTEARGFRSSAKVWPLHNGDFGRNDVFLVTSLGLTI